MIKGLSNYMKKSTVYRIKALVKFIGYTFPEKNTKAVKSYKFYIVIILNCIGMIDSMRRCIDKWDDPSQKSESIMSIIVFSFSTIAILDIAINPEHHIFMFKIIDKPINVNISFALNEEQIKTQKQMDEHEKYAQYSYNMTAVIWCFKSIYQMFKGIEILYFLVNDNSTTINNPKMPFFSIPVNRLFTRKFEMISVYCIISIVQMYFLLIALLISSIWCFIATCTIKRLEMNLKILRLSIKYMDNEPTAKLLMYDSVEIFNESQEKEFFKFLVIYHQRIIMATKTVNYYIEGIMLVLNNVMGLLLGLKLYFALEGEGHWTDLADMGSCFLSFCVFCSFGQGIINENEFLHRELMWCFLKIKTLTHKKTLRLMMLCASKPLQIRPAFYTLNLNNVVKIANGTFSYYSIMRSLKMNNL